MAPWTLVVTALLKFLSLSTSAVLTSEETLVSITWLRCKLEFQQVGLFSVRGHLSIAEGVEESLTTWFFFSVSRPQFSLRNRPVSLAVVSQTPLLSAYPATANSLKTLGFLSSTYLTLHPAEGRDVLPFHVDSGSFMALLKTLSQTDLSRYKVHGSYLSGSGAQSR